MSPLVRTYGPVGYASCQPLLGQLDMFHDDVIKWEHFPLYWPFVRGIHRYPMNSPHKGQWRRALMFSLICTWIHGWVNTREADDLIRHRAHHDVTVMSLLSGVPDFFDRNKILSGGDLSHYQVPHCIRVFFYFVWFVFIHHNFQFYFELCTYCNILDIHLSWNLNFANYLLFYMKLLNYLFFNMFGSVLECCELTGVSLLWPWLIKWK